MGLTIVITGAGGGIGHALSLEYAQPGNHLILCDFDQQKLDATAELCRNIAETVETFTFSMENPAEIEKSADQMLEKHKSLDRIVFVNGISQRGKAINTSIVIDRKIMEINYFGIILLTKKLLPALLQTQHPKIGVTSSISGRFGFHQRSAYAASKFALHGFFESLRLEHHKDGLSVSIICPGRINTPISLSAINENGQKHGQMDPGQSNGMSAAKCAQKMRKVIEKGKKDVLIGKKELLMVYFRKYLPFIFYKFANKINSR
ncbi:MAG: SDR family NAD(P)-dependent oxidoreductase [Bacteroidota bacterium]|nr:SDR family NAD(P)-dependent oxidoreductase [Bacteroidota bacterium]